MHIKNLLERSAIVIACLVTTIITIFSFIQLGSIVSYSVSISDKALHTLAYFVLTCCWLYVSIVKNSDTRKNRLFVSFFAWVYGIIIEVLQGTLTTFRQVDMLDVVANSIGILFAWFLFELYSKKYRTI